MLPPLKWSQKNSPKNGPKNSPVHILPYAVHHGFVHLVDFPKLLPGRILSAVRLKICPPQKNVESQQTIRTCKVLVMTENLSTAMYINNFVASADRPIVTYEKGNVRQLKDDL